MTETIWGKGSFEERKTYYIDLLRKGPIEFVYEMAQFPCGSEFDPPFSPTDPAHVAAAQQLLDELGLVKKLSPRFRYY